MTVAESLIGSLLALIARQKMLVSGLNGRNASVEAEAGVDADAQSRSELHLSLQVATARRSPAWPAARP